MTHKQATIDGQRIPSVTEILNAMDKLDPETGKPVIKEWYAMEELRRVQNLFWRGNTYYGIRNMVTEFITNRAFAADIKSDEAKEIGTEVHEAIYNVLRNEPYYVREVLEPVVRQFIRWWDCGKDYEIVELEKTVVSRSWRYQGTFDALLKDRRTGELVMADWKTSKRMDRSYGLQLAAYAHAYMEEHPSAVIGRGIAVRIDKRPKEAYRLEPMEFKPLSAYFDVFASLRLPFDFIFREGIWNSSNSTSGSCTGSSTTGTDGATSGA